MKEGRGREEQDQKGRSQIICMGEYRLENLVQNGEPAQKEHLLPILMKEMTGQTQWVKAFGDIT